MSTTQAGSSDSSSNNNYKNMTMPQTHTTPLIEITCNNVADNMLIEPLPQNSIAKPDDTLSLHSVQSQAIQSESSCSITKSSTNRRVFIMRHGERIDFTFGTWIPYCFDEFGQYVRRDLNMPKTLPRRKNSPEGWQNDSPLTNVGTYLARLTGEALRDAAVKIDHVYCSPSFRCLQTCASALEGLELCDKPKINLEPGLFEWLAWYPEGVPDWLSQDEILEENYNININYKPIMNVSQLSECLKESSEEFYTRNYTTLCKILAVTQGNILVVAHATTLDTCTRQLIGEAPRSTNDLRKVIHKIPYCSLTNVEEIESGVWKLLEPASLPITHSKNPRFEWNALTAT